MSPISERTLVMIIALLILLFADLVGNASSASAEAFSVNQTNWTKFKRTSAPSSNEVAELIRALSTSTNRVDWIKHKGFVSLLELNSKCDFLVIASIVKPQQIRNSHFITEITIDSVLAAKWTNNEAFPGESDRKQLLPINGYICNKLPESFGGNDSTPALLSGGQFLLWLSKMETADPLNTTDARLLSTERRDQKSLPSPRFTVTCGARGAYLLNDIQSVQKNMPGSFIFNPYPWQQQFLDVLIKTNDIARFKRIVVDVARALKNDKTSTLLLQSMAKSSTDPVLGGIAKEHLNKGITNIFDYVNPGPIP